ncbi:rab-GTPase-TBC domain-containing protein [Scheffersomyces xylosifermentans]|uniref:rab-GTPase-TBC domain-containing protein n=1 Tax=Scheffersomyces xylosifermentans TaxID=1304137 RepID=UPI00315CF417
MGKKKQEMSQVYNNSKNEFIFGENGGKGKHLSSFLRNLSLTGSSSTASVNSKSSENYQEINSSIYGTLGYGSSKINGSQSNAGSIVSTPPALGRSPTSQRAVSVGASYSHVTATPPPEASVGGANSRTSPYLHNHLGSTASTTSASGGSRPQYHRRSHSNTMYRDLDDDWDAELPIEGAASKKNSIDNRTLTRLTQVESNSSSRSSINLQPSPILDSLYPDLTIPAAATASSLNLNSSSPKYNKESMDVEDYQAKLEINKLNQLNTKYAKFKTLLTGDSSINITDLRKLSWNGIPQELRALTWQILLGYLPTNKSRQASTLKRKRQEYLEGLGVVTIDFHESAPSNNSSTSLSNNSSNSRDKQLYHQIKIDVKRTNPTIKLYGYPETQESLRKILFLWAVRHPASGYVQGINDLCTPFYQIFLNNYIWQLQRTKMGGGAVEKNEDVQLFIPGLLDESDDKEQALLNDPKLMTYTLDNFDPSLLSGRIVAIIEADTYWCLSRLLENITDNYIHEQPGIIRQVNELRTLISKIDLELINHLDSEGVEFIQFSFRWMNCLLMRELSIPLVIRMWDTYLSETPLGFNIFHVYVCAAFLIKFSSDLKEKDFQEILLFLQNPPTGHWKEKDIELMLSEAFIWQSLYKHASAHLR